MNITVSVIDGVSGHPAEGVEVSVVGRSVGEQRCLGGLTDPEGNFTYSPEEELPSKGEYTVELDVDAYFASLGIMTAGYKQVTVLVRTVHTQTDYRIGMLITPFAHATWSVR